MDISRFTVSLCFFWRYGERFSCLGLPIWVYYRADLGVGFPFSSSRQGGCLILSLLSPGLIIRLQLSKYYVMSYWVIAGLCSWPFCEGGFFSCLLSSGQKGKYNPPPTHTRPLFSNSAYGIFCCLDERRKTHTVVGGGRVWERRPWWGESERIVGVEISCICVCVGGGEKSSTFFHSKKFLTTIPPLTNSLIPYRPERPLSPSRNSLCV